MNNRLLAVAAMAEALTGLVLLIYPAIVIKLLFGVDVAGIGLVISRFAGIALLVLGIACWPRTAASCAVTGMLTYNALATLGLVYIALNGTAGSYATRGAYTVSCSGVEQAIRGRIALIRRAPCLERFNAVTMRGFVLHIIALKSYRRGPSRHEKIILTPHWQPR